MPEPIKVLVTEAAGQIAYSLLYSVAKGDVFGKDQPINLVLLDIAELIEVLIGVASELQDCALSVVQEILLTDKEEYAFKGIDVAFLVGAKPSQDGMERKDLLAANVKMFKEQGKALDDHAKKTVKVVVVGSQANTNAFICSKFAPSIPKENFSALTRLDQNRAQFQIAQQLQVSNNAVKNCIIWGNHSSDQFIDVSHATVTKNGGEQPVTEAVKDDHWLNNEFIKTVQNRGAQVMIARKLSSAMSAAWAICDHMRDWWFGTREGEWVSMAVPSDGSYKIEKNLMYSFPVTIKNGMYTIVQGLNIDENAMEKMDRSMKQLQEERDMALAACQE